MTNVEQSKLRSVQFLIGNNFLEAIKDFDKAIELNPEDFENWNLRGACKYNLNNFEEAIQDFGKAIKINPDKSILYKNRASAKRKLGDNKGADEDDKKAEVGIK